jgi:hypothetical protein
VDISGLVLLAAALALLLVIAVVGGSLEVLLAAFYARIIGDAAERKARTKRIQ